jgi:hypothetical protein
MAVSDPGPFPGTVIEVPDLVGDAVAGEVSVVDTTEVRWFAEGRLPPEVVSWFTRDDTTGVVETRCDTYRMDLRCEMGVKRRFRETLELKIRRSFGDTVVLDAGLAGRLEVWRKWSPAEGLVEGDGRAPWVDVHKAVVKRRFSLDGDEIILSNDQRTMSGTGCDVEVADVTVGDIEAWTFAFAAFGPPPTRRDALVASWQALAAATPCPERFGPFIGRSYGYPEWLAIVTSPTTPDHQLA